MHWDALRADRNAALQSKITKVQQEPGNQWFVTFESESDALDAAIWVKANDNVGCKVA